MLLSCVSTSFYSADATFFKSTFLSQHLLLRLLYRFFLSYSSSYVYSIFFPYFTIIFFRPYFYSISLPLYFCVLIFILDSFKIPQTIFKAISDPNQKTCHAQWDDSIKLNGNCVVVSLFYNKPTLNCKLMVTMKAFPNGSVERLKTRLVAKGYASIYALSSMERLLQVSMCF